jgi:hypothetical protein
MPGIVSKQFSISEFEKTSKDGWRMLNSEMLDAISFLRDHFINSNLFVEFSQLDSFIKRGQAGNSGGSDILFFDSRTELYDKFRNRPIIYSVGMRNAKLETFDIGIGDRKFLDYSCNSDKIINEIISTYLSLPEREGKQQRKNKTNFEWIQILKKESEKVFPSNSVLIPRAIRVKGKVYLSCNPVFVSTNFIVCTLPTFDKALILSTWISTVFYQLICEVSSKDQEGMRKMEVADIEKTYIPVFEKIKQTTIKELEKEYKSMKFLNLTKPEIRIVDIIWAKELFYEKADYMLKETIRLLHYLANRRNT